MGGEPQVFRSRVDAWLVVVLGIALAATWLEAVRKAWAGRPVEPLDVIVPLFTTTLLVWVYRTTTYTITEDVLVVRSGPLRRTIPLREVHALRATHNPMGAPALSLRRIEVTYGPNRQRVLISPTDTPAFVAAARKVLKKYEDKDPFFKKVLDSQREFAKVVAPYWRENVKLSVMISGSVGGTS